MMANFFALLILPLVVSVTNQSSAKVETTVKTEVSGQNASVSTQIINNVNGKETKVESSAPGEIKVSVKDGQAETKIYVSPASQTQIQKEIQQFRQLLEDYLKKILGLFKPG